MDKMLTVCDNPIHLGRDVLATSTFLIELDGKQLRLDSCDNCVGAVEELEILLQQVRKNSQVLDDSPASPIRPRTARDPLSALIREWAKENGLPCPSRGRIPDSLRERYLAREHPLSRVV